ncbi:transporter [Pseudomonas aeruginosa]|nr:transporter [Pseudomonas aeruginosa]
MSFSLWLLVLGCILLTLGLASAYLRLLPVSTSFIYLLFGLAIGPAGLHAWRSGLADISGWFEHLSEAALLISLFIGGLKLRLPLRSPAWTAAWLLAGPVLLGCILGLTLGAHFLFGLDWGLALLVAAILAPTDPVLASDIQVNHAGDDDRLRYAVSGEAGLNDGIAFPFVIAALLLIGQGGGLPGEFDRSGLDWLLRDVLWAIPLGLLVGYCLGHGLGRLAIHLRARHTDTSVSANDFLALALIALSYVGADALGGWGFLASFAAGIGLRHAEVATLGRASAPAEAQAAAADVREAGQASGAIEYGADRSEHPKGGGRRGDARRALLRQPAGALAGSAAGDPARRHALPALGLARAAAGAAAVLRVPAGDGLAAGRPAADAPGAAAPARLVRHPRHRQPVLPQLRAEPGGCLRRSRIPPATWC